MNVIEQIFLFDFSKCTSEYELQRKQLRLQEYCFCLLKNCQDPSIKSLHLFVDSEAARQFYMNVLSDYLVKIKFISHGKQPTYKELVEYARDNFADGEIVCIMNADIIFHSQKDHELIRKVAKPMKLLSLTRHEFTDDQHTICSEATCTFTVHGGSSDVFIFTLPIAQNFNYASIDYKQNVLGVEALFHKAWLDCGYKIINPCDDIITIHIHRDRVHFQQYDNYLGEQALGPEYMNLKTKLEL